MISFVFSRGRSAYILASLIYIYYCCNSRGLCDQPASQPGDKRSGSMPRREDFTSMKKNLPSLRFETARNLSNYQFFSFAQNDLLCNAHQSNKLLDDLDGENAPTLKLSIKNGQQIGLVCPYCSEITPDSYFAWYRVSADPNERFVHADRPSDSNSHHRLYQLDHVLLIDAYQPDVDSGIYFCVSDAFGLGKTRHQMEINMVKMFWRSEDDPRDDQRRRLVLSPLFARFHLDRRRAVERKVEQQASLLVLPLNGGGQPDTMKMVNFSTDTFRVYNEWAEWSSTCERCGRDSVRYRKSECKMAYGQVEWTSDSSLWNSFMRQLSVKSCLSNHAHLLDDLYEHGFDLAASLLGDYFQIDNCSIDCDSFERIKYHESVLVIFAVIKFD